MTPKNKANLPMDQIIKEYQSGMSTRQLGKKYGVSDVCIFYRMKKAGVQLRTRGWAGHNKVELPMGQIIFGYLQLGMTAYELGDKYGCSEFTIRKRLKEAGVHVTRNISLRGLNDEIETVS